jgi:hypothetical protein
MLSELPWIPAIGVRKHAVLRTAMRGNERNVLPAHAASRSDSLVKQPGFLEGVGSQRSASCILCRGPGQACLLSLANSEGDGAPRGAPTISALWARRASGATHAPRGAPPAAFLSPAPCFRGAHLAGFDTRKSGAASATRCRSIVQPLKAAGHSAGGRLAEASRPCGYEPQRRAPHPAPPSGSSLEDAPRRAGRVQIKCAALTGDKFFCATCL